MLTDTLEFDSRCGEQQFALHALWPGAPGDPRLLVAALHPVGQPEEATVAVQWVRSDRPGNQTTNSQQTQGEEGRRGSQDGEGRKSCVKICAIMFTATWWSAQSSELNTVKHTTAEHCMNTHRQTHSCPLMTDYDITIHPSINPSSHLVNCCFS